MRFKLWTPTNSTTGSLNDIMTLRSNGNVGIGTASPGAKLDVNGGVSANSFVVRGGQFYGITLNMLSSSTSGDYRKVATIPGGIYTIYIKTIKYGDNTYSEKMFDVALNKGQFGVSQITSHNVVEQERYDSTYGDWPVIQHDFTTNGYNTTGNLRLNLYNANAASADVQFSVTVALVGTTQAAMTKDFTDEW
jgi:hypothetical protein